MVILWSATWPKLNHVLTACYYFIVIRLSRDSLLRGVTISVTIFSFGRSDGAFWLVELNFWILFGWIQSCCTFSCLTFVQQCFIFRPGLCTAVTCFRLSLFVQQLLVIGKHACNTHTPVCMLATSIGSMSTGVTTSLDSEWEPGLLAQLWTVVQPKETASFLSCRWNVGTNPDLAFASFGQDSRLPDRHVLGKFLRSQHGPSLITPPKFKVAAHSDPVKRWNVRKAD